MTDATEPLLYAHDMDEVVGSRHRLARDAVAGVLQRVSRGAYIDAAVWRGLRDRERYRRLVQAVAETRQSRPVFSFWSAAVVHGLPVVGAWPTVAHVSVGAANGGRSSGHIVRHVAPLAETDIVEVEGLLVTSVARTLIDMAGLPATLTAVAMADRALHIERFGRTPPMTSREALEAAFAARLPFRTRARVRRVLDFAVEEADSVLESVSRFNMRVIGVPQPTLQHRFDDHLGLIGFSEFYWQDYKLVGESDGRIKYLDPAYRNGRTLERVLYDEKVRADRLGSLGLRVSRWDWDTALSPEALRRHLAAEGLPTGQRW